MYIYIAHLLQGFPGGASGKEYPMEYHSAIKKNAFESVLMRQMNLEPIIQREVSQKGKYQYSILMHLYGIQKDGNDDPIHEMEKAMATQSKTLAWKIPWTEEPGGLPSMGLLGVGHD